MLIVRKSVVFAVLCDYELFAVLVLLPLMTSFNKTEAAIFFIQAVHREDFPFSQLK